jgi:hypothetical protein
MKFAVDFGGESGPISLPPRFWQDAGALQTAVPASMHEGDLRNI